MTKLSQVKRQNLSKITFPFVLVDTKMIAKLDTIKRIANWLKNVNLGEATKIIFEKYEGNPINIDNVDDAAICKEAIYAFDYIKPYMLDFGPKSRKYVLDCNATKIWHREKGISIAKEELLPKDSSCFHERVVRQDANTFLLDWWNQIITTDSGIACTHTAYLCNEAFKVGHKRT